jgi:hypothetical protein
MIRIARCDRDRMIKLLAACIVLIVLAIAAGAYLHFSPVIPIFVIVTPAVSSGRRAGWIGGSATAFTCDVTISSSSAAIPTTLQIAKVPTRNTASRIKLSGRSQVPISGRGATTMYCSHVIIKLA